MPARAKKKTSAESILDRVKRLEAKLEEAAARQKRTTADSRERGLLDQVPDDAAPRDPDDLTIREPYYDVTGEGVTVENEAGARDRERRAKEKARRTRDNSIPRNFVAGALEGAVDTAAFLGAGAGVARGLWGNAPSAAEIAGAVSGGFRENVTHPYIAGTPDETGAVISRVAGEEAVGAIPGLTVASKAGKAGRLTRAVAGSGRRERNLAGGSRFAREGSIETRDTAGQALRMEAAQAGATTGARSLYQLNTPEEERSIAEAAIGMAGGFAPAAGVALGRGTAAGFRSWRNIFGVPARELAADGVYRSREAMDEASLALRERAGIGDQPHQLPLDRALARLKRASQIEAEEGIPTTFGSALDTRAARDIEARVARTSPTYAAYIEDMERQGRTGVQAKIAALGPPESVTSREAARAGAKAQVDQAFDAIGQEIDGLDLDEVGRQQMVYQRLEETWQAAKADLENDWNALYQSAKAYPATLEPPAGSSAPHAFPEVAELVDELEHQNRLTESIDHPDARLLGALKRRLLGLEDEAADSAAQVGRDFESMLGLEVEEFMAARRARAGVDDAPEDDIPPPGNPETVIAFRKHLGDLIDAQDGPTGNSVLKRRYTRIKAALDRDLAEWAEENADSDFAQRLVDVNAKTSAVYERFKDGATGHVLGFRGSQPGDYQLLEFYAKNPGRMEEFIQKFPEFKGDMIDHLVAKAWNASSDQTGAPHPKALSAFLKRNRQVLLYMPEARAKLGTIEALSRNADELGIRRPRSKEAVARGALYAYIDDPSAAFDSIRRSSNPYKATRNLMDSLPTEEARNGARAEFWDLAMQRLQSSKRVGLGTGGGLPGDSTRITTIEAGTLVSWLADAGNREVGRALFGEQHIDNLHTLATRIDLIDSLPSDFHLKTPAERASFLKTFTGSGVLSVIQRPLLRTLRWARLIDRISAVATQEEAHAILQAAMTDKRLAAQLLVRTTRDESRVALARISSNQRSVAPRVWAQLQGEDAMREKEREERSSSRFAPPPPNSTAGLGGP